MDSLPNEILNEILWYVEGNYINYALVCRRFDRPCISRLWERIKLYPAKGFMKFEEFITSSNTTTRYPYGSFIRCLDIIENDSFRMTNEFIEGIHRYCPCIQNLSAYFDRQTAVEVIQGVM